MGQTSKIIAIIMFKTTFDRRLGYDIIRKFKIAIGDMSVILALFCIIKYVFTFLPKSNHQITIEESFTLSPYNKNFLTIEESFTL